MTIYFISGLGADRRMFKKLTLPAHLKIKYIDWIPQLKNESLTNYAHRLLLQIDTSEPFQLVGLSFGGIIAIEISKIIKPEQTIIISSVSTRGQIPWYYKFAEQLKLQLLLPGSFLKFSNSITFWFLGAKAVGQRELLKQILIDTDGNFLKWAIGKIARWDNKIKIKNLYHIHGTADKILPIKFIEPDQIISGGGHLMVYDRFEEISHILTERIANY